MVARDTSPSSTSSTLSNITVQTEKLADVRIMSSASPSISTPPTSLDDEYSTLADITKVEQLGEAFDGPHIPQSLVLAPGTPQADPEAPPSEGRRSFRSSRKSVTTYNVQILAGTAIHTPTKYLEKHHKNVVHGALEAAKAGKDGSTVAGKRRALSSKSKSGSINTEDPVEEQLAAEAAQAARRRTSSRVTDLRKEALRNISGVGQVVANALSDGKTLVQKTLRRSASDGALKSVKVKRSITATEDEDGSNAEEAEEKKEFFKPKSKVWLRQGLYVGQHRDFDPRLSESQNRARKRAKRAHVVDVLPLPMFAADRVMNEDPHHVYKDFKLPFDTYNPLPRKIKVDGWVKLHKNRFIGDASALWKRDKQDSSQCYCNPEDGCGDSCHNRIMAYECDDTNCRLGRELCCNRPFAELKRRAKGNRYDYGVEVLHTEDRGFGVRAMRMFDPYQIIVEYAGEIITQQECERRMKQVYKKDKCYYLMSFDNKMIIDATRGTIARFVNHSCEPNCEMIKWTVNGEPRMALFAGARGIMTGEELTYDYNFDPFSQKNIQECRCGTQNCRGVLGPKPKKPVEDRSMTSAIIAGTKRKFQDIMGSMAHRGMSEDKQMSPKKRKLYANAATTKAKNAGVQSTVARERAERDAAEHSRQIASRQTRALKRSTPITNSRRQNSKNLRNNLPTIKSTRTTTVSFQRKVPKSGALKAVKQPSRFRVISRNTKAALGSSKKSEAHDRPSTPPRSSHALQSGSDEDNSPNITPASLRSASKKLRPSFEAKPSSKGKNRTEKNRPLRTYATGGSRMHQRTVKSASEDPSQTDVETGNSVETAQSKSRNSSVRCVKL